MKNFSAIEESHFINGPAAVDLQSAVLYINPREWNKLSPVAKNFVIAHELGHLNSAVDSEFAADKWAFWHRLELGDSSIDLLKEFYRTLPFGTPEQIQRAEEMLRTVLAGEERNETVAPLFQMIKTPVQHNGNTREFIGAIISGASAITSVVIGGIKNRKAKKAAEKEAKAIEAEEKKIQGEVQNQTLRLANEQRLLQNLEDMEAMAAAEKQAKKSKTTKNIIIVVVIALVAAGAYFYFKSKK